MKNNSIIIVIEAGSIGQAIARRAGLVNTFYWRTFIGKMWWLLQKPILIRALR